jgi:type III restriction enzyme
MATGSGKTKVMSMAIVWQYFNAILENNTECATTSLLIAPNVIVYERLRNDFAGGRIFKVDPLIPSELDIYWDFDCILRGETERATTQGCLYLSNIQRLYPKSEQSDEDEVDVMTAVLGKNPRKNMYDEPMAFRDMLAKREGKLLVINDEAHHTHDEANEWNATLRDMQTVLPITAQLDLSATPRYTKGNLFPWVIFDYPIRQAILDNIVKRPVKGLTHVDEVKSDDASTRYRGYLVTAVARWKEYQEQLAPSGKKPILFIMMNTREEADQVGDWVRHAYPSDFAGSKTLIIHTDKKGEVSTKDLEQARTLAHDVDDPASGVNAIVSVLMLREGWDVQNVTVVVGLRPYTAKANILPEQAIGRGLRLMFREEGSGYQERVDIIGNKKFLEFVEELEKMEDITFDSEDLDTDKLHILTVQPVIPEKALYDLELPRLSPVLIRKKSLAEEIDSVDVATLIFSPFPLPLKPAMTDVEMVQYQAFDVLTDEKLFEREYPVPQAQTAEEIIAYYARLIAAQLKLPSQFAHLEPKVQAFFEQRAYGEQVDLTDTHIIQAMNNNVAAYAVMKAFTDVLRGKIIEERTPFIEGISYALSQMQSFPYSRPVYEARKCVLNVVPCMNEFEKEFARFLDTASDVTAFSALPMQFGFSIDYTDEHTNLRYYSHSKEEPYP